MKTRTAKKVRITVDPETFEKLSPEGIKAAVTRRIATASKNRRQRFANALCVFFAVLTLMFVVAFAGTAKQAETIDEHQCSVNTVVVWQGGMTPWDIGDEDKDLLMSIVMSAACGENKLAQQAVAQSIRNSCEDFNMTVSEVAAEFRWPTGYAGKVSDSAREAVEDVIDGYQAVNAHIYFAYNPAVQEGEWHESLDFICQIGNLRFFA